jgi:hypothetical protein
MDLGLTTQQKISALTGSKVGIQGEVYNLLVRMGVDPDTYTSGDDIAPNDSFVGEKLRLENLIQSLTLIESKLAELS